MAHFDLILQTVGSLHPHGEPDEYISEYLGVIRCLRERDNKVFRVGKVRAYRVHAGLAADHGESLFDVCDAHSQEMHELHAALFTAERDQLKPSVIDKFDALDSDVLVIDYVVLNPRWRGLKIGLLAVRKMVDLLGGGCGLATCDIAPLDPDARDLLRVPESWLPVHRSQGERSVAVRKLRRYFRRMGFERIGRTPHHGLSIIRKVPNAAELLQPTPYR